MTSFNVDVGFLQKHTRDRGLVLLESATKENPQLLMEILQAGWGETTCLENPSIGRKFLTQLRYIAQPEDAKQAIELYFRNATPEVVTQQVVGSSPSEGNSSPLIEWLGQSANRPVVAALLAETRSFGANFEQSMRAFPLLGEMAA